MEYAGVPLATAAGDVIYRKLPQGENTGGVIAMDSDGNIVMPFNTPGMYRGWIGVDGVVTTAIFRDP